MKANNTLLSVIIPIFKVEKFLSQCIESILEQTYTNLEILLIDDGSPDQCGSICDEYEKKDYRIKVFHKENGGNADALNFGLRYATGEYVAFVDGDDYLSNKNALLHLMQEAFKTGADITIGNYHKDIAGTLINTREHGFCRNTDTLCEDFRFRGFYSVGHLAYTWAKVYKLSFLHEHQLRFKPYLYALDKLFNVECYIHAPKYSFVVESVYVYRFNHNSISHKYKKGFSKIWLNISEEMDLEIRKMGEDNLFLDLVAYNLLFAVFFSCKQEYIHSGNHRKEILSELKKYRNHKLVRLFVKEVAKGKYLNFHSSFQWKMFLWGMSVGICLRLLWITSLGIQFLVDIRMDERLSSTGKIKNKKC